MAAMWKTSRYCFHQSVHFHASCHSNSDGGACSVWFTEICFFPPLGWYWHWSLSRLQWAEGVRCGRLQGGWTEGTRLKALIGLENDVNYKGIDFCSVLTTPWLCCFFCTSILKRPTLLFSVPGLCTGPFALQIYSREEIVNPKHILRALNKEHCAVMHSVSLWIIKVQALCLFNYQSVVVETAISISGYNLKYCSVQIKNNGPGCLPCSSLATWSQVQLFSTCRKHCCCTLSGVQHYY